jgi:flavin-binding protein dodecin
LRKIFLVGKSKEGFTMSSVRQKMAAVQKAVNKAEEALRNGTAPEPVQERVLEESTSESEANAEGVAKPKVKAAPKKKAAPKAKVASKKAAPKAKAKSAPKGKKS